MNALEKPLRACLFIAFMVLGGLLLSFWLYWFLNERQTATIQQDFRVLTDQRMQVLEGHNTRSLEALYGLAAFLSEADNRSWTRFRHYVKGSLQRLPELQALEWISEVQGNERQHFEKLAHQEGLNLYQIKEFDGNGKLQKSAVRDRYYPVLYAYPENINVEAIGLDLASQPDRLAAINKAVETEDIVATAPVRLVQEKEEGYGVLIFAPVFQNPVGNRSANLDGFALAVYRCVDLLSAIFNDLDSQGINVTVRDSERQHLVLYSNSKQSVTPFSRKLSPSNPADNVVRQFDIGQRSWMVEFSPRAQYWQSQKRASVYVYPLLSALLVLAYGFHAATRLSHILQIEKQVQIRTQALTDEVDNRRLAEEAAQKAEQRYRSIFENSVDGIFQSTKEGRYLAANSALANIYGYESQETFIKEMQNIETQLYVEPGRRRAFIDIMLREGKVSDFVSKVYKRDGSEIYILEKAISVYSDSGEFLYFEGIVQDITERVQAEKALQKNTEWLEERVKQRTSELAKANEGLQEEVHIRKLAEQQAANANAAKTQFLASMSHEIRTPLNAIIGYSQILQQQDKFNEQQSLAINTIAQSGNHLLSLIDDILDLSKIESGLIEVQNKTFDLAATLINVVYIVRKKCEEKGLKLKVEGLGQNALWVQGDEIKFRQVLVNLLGNAVKYTEKGEVLLRVIPEDNDAYRFEVIDTGPGIPESELPKVFDQFYQRSDWRDGTGLGLSISSRIIKTMGSELKVQSTPGMGSNFFFRLRFPPSHVPFVRETRALPSFVRLAPEQKCFAMVVDDVQHNRDILKKMLESIGCSVLTAESGPLAVEYIQMQSVDIVFMDILMPEMDGIEARRAMLAARPGLNAVFVAFSASAYEEQQRQYLAQGFDDIIAKPYRMEQLNQCLEKHLNLRFDTVPDTENSDSKLHSYSDLQIPEGLIETALNATRAYNITQVRNTINDIANLSEEHKAFAHNARFLAQQHRFDELESFIQKCTSPPPSVPQEKEQ